MKQYQRFFVFTMTGYYPSGGMDDFHSSFETELEALIVAQASLARHHCDWIQVWDTEDSPTNTRTYNLASIDERIAEVNE